MNKKSTTLTSKNLNAFKENSFINSIFLRNLPRAWFFLFLLFVFATITPYKNITAQITSGFELEGDATAVNPNPPDDWDLIYNNTSNAVVNSGILVDLPSFPPNSDDVFTSGTKETDDISDWHWTYGNVPDKADLLHAGVALYDSCKLYFFADRYAVNGSSGIGFWLLQNPVSLNLNGTFNGVHTIGDIFIMSEFMHGGSTAQLHAFKWVGSGGSHGSLDSLSLTGATLYATVNMMNEPSPWPYEPKNDTINIFPENAFFEGGIDLCALGLSPCYISFIAKTCASHNMNAASQDLMLGSISIMPIADAGADTLLDCTTGQVILMGSASTPYAAFNWTATNGGRIVSGANTPNPIVDTSGTYILMVTDTLTGCSDSDTVEVTLYGPGTPINIIYKVNGVIVPTLNDNVLPGSVVEVTFTLPPSSDDTRFSLVSYTAPDSVFDDSTAHLQEVYDYDTGVFTEGTHTLMIDIPNCFFQMDFVYGCIIEELGPAGSNNFYSSQGRLIDADNGGSVPCICILTADAGPDMMLTCLISQVYLSGSASDSTVTYSWVVSNGGNIVSGANTPTPLVNASGTYILTVTDTMTNCLASDTAIVTSDTTTPIVDLGADTILTVCFATIILDAGNPGSMYLWNTGETTQTIIVGMTGTYYVIVTDSSGCMGSDTINVTIPFVDVDLGPDTTVCGCITLDADNQGSTYLWCDGSTYQTFEACTTGMYCVKVITGYGCVDYDTIMITVNPPLVVDLGPDIIQNGGTVTLDADITNASYLWSTGDTTQTIEVSMSGTYWVEVTDSLGCVGEDTVMVTIIMGITDPYGENSNIVVYPNPSDKNFNLSFNIINRQDIEVKVVNYLGKVFYKESIKGFAGDYNKQIDISQASSGIYFVEVSYEGFTKYIKISIH